MSASFLNDYKIIYCLGNYLGLFKPPLYESPPLCQLKEGPYIFATSFNSVIAAVAQNDTAGPPRTQFFLLLYQEKSSNDLMKSIEFPSKILGLKSTPIHLFVSISKTIQVFDLKSFLSVSTLNETSSSGIFAVNQQYIAWPDDAKPGRICIATIFDFKVKFKINCHNSEIKCMVFSNESNTSSYLITSSKKGTIIRLFDCSNGQMVTEFRRGYTQGNVVAIDMKFGILCVCTTTTVHIFILSNAQQLEGDTNSGQTSRTNDHSSSIISAFLSFVPSSLKGVEDSENGNKNDPSFLHLTISPAGVPLACAVINNKNIFVVMDNEYLLKYEIADDCKKLVMKNALPLKVL